MSVSHCDYYWSRQRAGAFTPWFRKHCHGDANILMLDTEPVAGVRFFDLNR
jgi:hypothetical protein